MLINPYIFGTVASSVTPTENTITIASGKVASDLTNFPVMVRLSGLTSAFWANVRRDGGDIRVTTTGGTVIPHDLSRFDYAAQDGVLFFKASTIAAASANQWKITCGVSTLSKLPYTDTNGRNAVWSDYAAVLLFGESSHDRTGNGTPATIQNNGDPDQFSVVETSPSLGGTRQIQGVCSDGNYYYITYTNTGASPPSIIEKRDLSWTLISQNTTPIADTGAPINHLGGLDCNNGLLYVALQQWTGSESAERIGVWRTSDLSFVTVFNISAQHPGASGLTYCTEDDLLYVCSFTNSAKLWKYDPSSGAYVGEYVIDYWTPPGANFEFQGVHYWRGAFWLNSDAFDETYRVDYATRAIWGSGLFGNDVSAGGGEYEGIGSIGDSLLVAQSRVSGSVTYEVKRWKARDLAKAAGGGIKPNTSGDSVAVSGLAALTTYTIGLTVAFSAKGGVSSSPLSYMNSAVDNSRQTFAYRAASSNLAIWDINNSWLESSPAINPTLNQAYRLHSVYQGTTSRRLYVDGVQKNVQSGITALPATFNSLSMLREDNSVTEPFSGQLGFVYLRSGALSADWIAAEYANVNSPGTFCSITEG